MNIKSTVDGTVNNIYLHLVTHFIVEMGNGWRLIKDYVSDTLDQRASKKVKSLAVQKELNLAMIEHVSSSCYFSLLQKNKIKNIVILLIKNKVKKHPIVFLSLLYLGIFTNLCKAKSLLAQIVPNSNVIKI